MQQDDRQLLKRGAAQTTIDCTKLPTLDAGEPFLLPSEQVLRGREHMDAYVKQLTEEEAVAWDDRSIRRRWVWRVALGIPIALVIAFVGLGHSGLGARALFEDDRSLAELAALATRFDAHLARLSALAANCDAAKRQLLAIETGFAAREAALGELVHGDEGSTGRADGAHIIELDSTGGQVKMSFCFIPIATGTDTLRVEPILIETGAVRRD